MPPETPLTALAHAIQLAVTPVFLIAGVGALLGVLTNRLGRIIDRARLLEDRLRTLESRDRAEVQAELATLGRRARLANRAIGLATSSALLISAVVAAIFLGAFIGFDASTVVGLVFIAAMLALIGALLAFLREIQLATQSLPRWLGVGISHAERPAGAVHSREEL